MDKETKYALLQKSIRPAYWFLSLYAKTIRLVVENDEVFAARLELGGRVVFASWHQRFFGGFYVPRIYGSPHCIMISRSRDGDFVAGVVAHIGWRAIRGSSSLGGKEALRQMADALLQDRVGGHIVDGPLGPPRVIKPGLISLAQRTGAAICPAYVSYENPWVFNSWDRFMVPKPFSRALLRFDRTLISVPPDLDESQFEQIRLQVETQMIKGYESADHYFEERKSRFRN
jgi:lysophospholipid acyltransferase (LPLAT)-like uncharacterized protein